MNRKALFFLSALLLIPLAALLVFTFGSPFGARRGKVFPTRRADSGLSLPDPSAARLAATAAPARSSLNMLQGGSGISVDGQAPPIVTTPPPLPSGLTGGQGALPAPSDWKTRALQQAPPQTYAPPPPEPKAQRKLKTEASSKSNFMDFSFKKQDLKKKSFPPAPPLNQPRPRREPVKSAPKAAPPLPPPPPRAYKSRSVEESVQKVSQQTGLAPTDRQAPTPPQEVSIKEEGGIVDPNAIQGLPQRSIRRESKEGSPINAE